MTRGEQKFEPLIATVRDPGGCREADPQTSAYGAKRQPLAVYGLNIAIV
jgi:hypothetical protein